MEKAKPFFAKLILTPHHTQGREMKGLEGLEEFEDLVKRAKDCGFTHVNVSGLAERTDYRGENAGSPWTEWSISLPSIFKHCLPPGLEDAFPSDFVGRQMDFLKKKHDIVAGHGLKCAYWGNEPHWLSERVYAEHPEWRGARCDNSLRTVGMFFAPCVDNPEVLELYRHAVTELVTQAPLLDTFGFMTNDSGSGFCWSRQLYVNPNGNSGCRFRHMGDRVMGFLRAIKQGARDAGVDAEVALTWVYFPPEEARNIEARLEPGEELTIGSVAGWGGSAQIIGYANPVGLAASLFSARSSKQTRFFVNTGDPEWFTAFKVFNETPGMGTERDKMGFLCAAAGELYAEDVVDEVVDAWYRIAAAELVSGTWGAAIRRRMIVGTIGLRWLVRPLVAHPERLTDEEESYWLPYVYQSEGSQPEAYRDYCADTGSPHMTSWEAATGVSCTIDTIVDHLDAAIALFEKAREKTAHEEAKKKLHIEALRVRAQRCVVLTVRHTVQVAALIHERGRVEHLGATDPESPGNPEGSPGLYYMYRALRWELDNTNDLIGILKESPVPLIRATEDKSQEGAFIYGPDVAPNLEKKVRIMLSHWRDAEDGFYRPTLGG